MSISTHRMRLFDGQVYVIDKEGIVHGIKHVVVTEQY
jgi:hypothetical protein